MAPPAPPLANGAPNGETHQEISVTSSEEPRRNERPPIELFYDFVCPYAYLAWKQIDEVAKKARTTVILKPMLLGGVFRAIGAPDSPSMPPAKARLNQLDLARWSKRVDAPLKAPIDHPRRTVLALRSAIASGDLPRATRALFRAYWEEGRDVSDPGVVSAALDAEGLDGAAIVVRAESEDVKADLKKRTEEAVALGIFGAPTCVVRTAHGNEIFWGQDRLDHVVHAVTGEEWPTSGTEEQASLDAVTSATELQFYFDFSSPYAYLASTQVRALARRTRARLVLKPILLGALFKSIGTPNVPLLEMSDAKRAYSALELQRWAARWRVPFSFTPIFPLNSVKALRLVLVAPEERRADLVDAIFREAWVKNRDISSDDVLLDVLREVDSPPDLCQTITTDEAKALLRSATSEAEERGLCGVPSFVVRRTATEDGELYWGQDRLGLVEEALITAKAQG